MTEVVKTTASHKVKSSASRSVAYSISRHIGFVKLKQQTDGDTPRRFDLFTYT